MFYFIFHQQEGLLKNRLIVFESCIQQASFKKKAFAVCNSLQPIKQAFLKIKQRRNGSQHQSKPTQQI